MRKVMDDMNWPAPGDPGNLQVGTVPVARPGSFHQGYLHHWQSSAILRGLARRRRRWPGSARAAPAVKRHGRAGRALILASPGNIVAPATPSSPSRGARLRGAVTDPDAAGFEEGDGDSQDCPLHIRCSVAGHGHLRGRASARAGVTGATRVTGGAARGPQKPTSPRTRGACHWQPTDKTGLRGTRRHGCYHAHISLLTSMNAGEHG